jgi:predicted RNA polymerase sigma factor
VVDAAGVLEDVWRSDAAGMRAVLARRLGDLDRAEEALQDAVGEALRRWPVDGVPERPAGWLVTTAWRKALDVLRREETGRAKTLLLDPPAAPTGDDRLAMIFACCHPALSEPAQVALTLSAVSGLATEEIAAAHLVPTATLAQRLVRAKRTLRGASFAVPGPAERHERLPAVLATVYLVFNQGYDAARRDLAREGLELARQLADLVPDEPEAAGLAALLTLHEARAATRVDAAGRLVLLSDQDRSRWDRAMIADGVRRLARAAALDAPGPYQLQAAIAAQHALAPSYADTDWAAVRRLYDQLLTHAPSPVVALGRAVATGFVDGPAAALAETDALEPRLAGYRMWHATRADLLAKLGRRAEAADATRRALALATNDAERELLARRLAALVSS